jgi:hypothetical protein
MAAGRKTGGRQKGTPNKITKTLREAVLGAFDDAGGQQYLVRMSQEQPAAFMTLLGKVLPMTLAGEPSAPILNRIELVAVPPKPRPEELPAPNSSGQDGRGSPLPVEGRDQ